MVKAKLSGRYAAVLSIGEFRGLFTAYALSLLGDQLARLAIAVLVYDRTHSTLLTGLAFALTFLPWLVGGPLLSSVADRYPRREVLIGTDVARGLVVVVLAAVDLPLSVFLGLVILVAAMGPMFEAARSALLADVLHGDAYLAGLSLTSITVQASQVLGYAVGGLVVVAMTPRGALGLDAMTFFVSAVVVMLTLTPRPAPSVDDGAQRRSLVADAVGGARLVFTDPRLRALGQVAMLAATFSVAPEALAVPYANGLHAGTVAVGLLLAANPVGQVLGVFVVNRPWARGKRETLLRILSACTCAPLIACFTRPGLTMTLALFAVSGIAGAFSLLANSAFIEVVPCGMRARAVGLVMTGLIAGQGATMVIVGAMARLISPPIVIGLYAAIGTAVLTAVAIRWPCPEPAPQVDVPHQGASIERAAQVTA